MSIQPFLIAPQEVGLELDIEPWLLPDSAYVALDDAYLWRMRGKRRRGNQLLDRLVEFKTKTYTAAVTGADVTWNNTVDPLASQPITNVLIDTPVIGQTRIVFNSNTIANGDTFIMNGIGGTVGTVLNNIRFTASGVTGTTVDVAATSTGLVYGGGGTAYLHPIQPGSVTITIGAYTFTDLGDGTFTGSGSGTIDYFTGAITLNFAAQGGGPYDVVVNYSIYPCRPVMGLRTWQTIINSNFDLIAFDTVKSNLYNNGFVDISFYDTSGDAINWTGTDTDFFSHLNYQNAFFATNGVPGFHAQTITLVQADTPAVGSTRVTIGAHPLQIGDTVFITNILGTIGTGDPAFPASTGLNDKSFIVTAVGATTFDIAVTTTGLVYTSGGITYIPQHTILGDGIRWYANDTNVDGWVNFNPPLDPTNSLKGAHIMVAYRGRMVCLNTIEGDPATPGQFRTFKNRARWSQIGTPFYSGPVPQNQSSDGLAWRDDIPGRGNYADADTNEGITGAEFIRDTLIVHFERSSWQLRYTGNPAAPFVWVRINVEFGSLSQFSLVPFDRGILCVGNRGILTTDGNNVARIDLIIPDAVFAFFSQINGAKRVHGIRDYVTELVYWTFLNTSDAGEDGGPNNVYPNKLMVYNYRQNSWSTFNDSYTCFGYIQRQEGLNWEDAFQQWEDADFLWNAVEQDSLIPKIVAGTNQGYVMLMNQQSVNDRQLTVIGITNAAEAVITTCSDHNLITGQFVKITDVNGMTQINDLNSEIEVIDNFSFKCLDINSTAFGLYTNGGHVTRINNFIITTKKFNPFVAEGKSVLLRYIDFFTDYFEDGQITVKIFVDENEDTPVNIPAPGDPQIWQSILPLDQTTTAGLDVDKTWTRFNCSARGQFIQFEMTMSKEQILNDTINSQEFTWHAFTLHLGKAGGLIK